MVTQRDKYSLTLEELRAVLDYDPDTGIFKWREASNIRKDIRGKLAGTIQYDGYRCIRVKPYRYYAQVLAWFYTWGKWPDHQVDHRDTNRDNNAIDNLRLASPIENGNNSRRSRRNTTGFKGVCRYKDKWMAQCRVKGRKRYLGVFDTAEEAHAAYKVAALDGHGEFARPDG